MTYLKTLAIALAVIFFSPLNTAHASSEITVYKSPYCGCCTAWSEHLRENGFKITEIKREDMDTVKRDLGVPERLESCHTAMVDGYVIEGHVPANDIKRLLDEKPKAKGLSVPACPSGLPAWNKAIKKIVMSPSFLMTTTWPPLPVTKSYLYN